MASIAVEPLLIAPHLPRAGGAFRSHGRELSEDAEWGAWPARGGPSWHLANTSCARDGLPALSREWGAGLLVTHSRRRRPVSNPGDFEPAA
jgi:hypothetical protein